MDFSVFSPRGLSAALTAGGHKVSERTVARWKTGVPPTRDDLKAIQALLFPEMTEGAAPSVTRRLLAGVIALENRSNISDSERAAAMAAAEGYEALALEADSRLAERIEQSQHKHVALPGGPSVSPADESQGSRRRKPRQRGQG